MTETIQASRHRFPYKNAFLGFILVMLVANVAILVADGDYGYRKYTSIVVTLMLLFNHVAFQYKLPKPFGTLAKLLAWTWLSIGLVYIGTVVSR
ncbi:hypothetical protein Poly51_49300 [Rubripirellula tenax]|uniref:Uncharacterized protein n=1 Tax=Rubripirellula tenax TaxID=2528015 RepID=A0A5C6EN73_9BACT|nr:hypothetical protein [Rubripirellula tenax]TWU49026.1 hypothetical protein Poly51_49300 [Rubripirellula tenax]